MERPLASDAHSGHALRETQDHPFPTDDELRGFLLDPRALEDRSVCECSYVVDRDSIPILGFAPRADHGVDERQPSL